MNLMQVRIYILITLNFFLIYSQPTTTPVTPQNPFNSIQDTYAWKTMDGKQVYYIKNNESYLFSSFWFTPTKITGKSYLFLKEKFEGTIKTNGFYFGVLLGGDIMSSDMTTFHYMGDRGWMVGDCWSDPNQSPKAIKLDTGFTPKGKIDAKAEKMGYIDLSSNNNFDGYQSLFIFEWNKDITNPDKTYDWADAKDAETKGGKTGAAWGYKDVNHSSTPHKYRTKTNNNLQLVDGSGFTEINTQTTANPTTGSSYLYLGLIIFVLALII